MTIARAHDHFSVICGGVRYELIVERLLKSELRQYESALQPSIDAFEEASEPYNVEKARAEAEGRQPDFSGLPDLPNQNDELYDTTMAFLRTRAISITVIDEDAEEAFDARANPDEFDDWVDAWVPEGPVIYWGSMMRTAKKGNSVARADSQG